MTSYAPDHAAEDRDDAAEIRDTAAEERDKAAELDDTAADNRDRRTEERDAAPDEREDAAEERDTVADVRDSKAEERDAAADVRDIKAEERAGAREERVGAAEERQSATEERDNAAAERGRATEERHRLALTRNGAAGEREAAESFSIMEDDHAARDRGRAASDRGRSSGDREASADDRREASRDREEAGIDALTGTRRRDRGLFDLQREIDRVRRSDGRLVLAFVDVDGLKVLNDARGHAAGDELLRNVGEALIAGLRSYDLVIRYGGDEFLCAVTGTDIESARARLDEVARELTGMSPTSSISMGLVALDGSESLDDLVERADAALMTGRPGARRR